MPSSLATHAEFYRIGIQTGLVTQDEVRDWAMAVIDRLQEPPIASRGVV
jgi:hypothetical protein